jgi:hypothetical protein
MVVLVSSTSTNGVVIMRIVMLAAPILIDRSLTNYCAGVSGKGNRINPRWWPNKKSNGHLSPWSRTNIYHLPASRPKPVYDRCEGYVHQRIVFRVKFAKHIGKVGQ